ncbi:AMMECR1 domain-containing protein [Patescibacteria group bacterium]|nr:AMMECR1 domain-containing protein [Patescibacteria group bacterium]
MKKKLLYILTVLNLILLGVNFGNFTNTQEIQTSIIKAQPQTEDELLSKENQTWALQTAKETILQYLEDGTTYEPTEIPEVFLSEPKAIFVSLYNKETNELRSCIGKTGENTLLESLIKASQHSTQDTRFDTLTEEELNSTEIVISILEKSTQINDPFDENSIELGLDGIRLFEGQVPKALLLPSIPISHNLDFNTYFEQLCKKAGLEKTCREDPNNNFYKFQTFTFTQEGELYRYNNHLEEISREEVEPMLLSSGEWLLDKTTDNGRFKYIYYPSTDKYSADYNIVRHLGTSYAMLLMYEYTSDSRYLEETEKAIEYFLKYTIEEDDIAYIEYEGEEDEPLGGPALAVVTLQKYEDLTNSGQYTTLLEKFGNFILSKQKENGNFANYYPEEKLDRKISYEIYGAEANLALSRLYAATGDIDYLEALQKSYEYTQEYFDASPSTVMVAWDAAAFSELYYETENQRYADLTYQMVDWIVAQQYTESNSPYPDYIGAFVYGGTPSSCNTGTLSEGVSVALELARYQGDDDKKDIYKETLKNSLRFLANMQYREDNSFFLPSPQEAIGGFRDNLYSNEQRIDISQHAISAIKKSLENWVY